ncbi:MAG: GH3 auxin-responsive promoter family protein [Pseudomonadota bacterium]
MAPRWSTAVQGAADRLRARCQQAGAVQQAHLAALLRRNQDTEFGRAHGFAGMRDSGDYAAQVPVRGHEALPPGSSAPRKGEPVC